MDSVVFCPTCGRIENYCICDIVVQVIEPLEPNFRWEYAMEKLSGHPTQFWDILPEYE